MRQTVFTIVLIVVLVVTGGVWFRYIRRPAPEALSPGPRVGEEERLAQYRQLKNLKPDTSVLSDPLFQALERPGVLSASPAAPSGRANPFAPF